ncbi:MAG: 4-hydroxy-tetrahydrodipicolinate reductase, partial [Silvibacterium sp.]|nr:4-hydroxy-tetrahydrodipicolinate reductase [Silvibacterium sp.]
TIKQVLENANSSLAVKIVSRREGDAVGLHVIEARSANDYIELRHEALSRRGFAEGAIRAAEWIAGKTGVWEFSEIAGQLG